MCNHAWHDNHWLSIYRDIETSHKIIWESSKNLKQKHVNKDHILLYNPNRILMSKAWPLSTIFSGVWVSTHRSHGIWPKQQVQKLRNCLGINANSTKVLLSVSATCFEWPKRVAQYHNKGFLHWLFKLMETSSIIEEQDALRHHPKFYANRSLPAFWRMITKRVQTKSDLLQILDLTTWDQKSANHAFWRKKT